MESEEMQKPKLILPDEFSPEDLQQPEYVHPLAEAARAIREQNLYLIGRAKSRDFHPANELRYTENGAHANIHDFFEAVAMYEEGRVPGFVLDEMVATTYAHLDQLEKRPRAPMDELDDVRGAFQKAAVLWARTYPKPRCPRKAYLKHVFKLEKEIFDALDKLHVAYRKQSPRKRRRRVFKADLDSVALKRKEDCARVYQAIKDLQDRKGCSVMRAIRQLKMLGTYAAAFGNLQDETWRTKYQRWLNCRFRFVQTPVSNCANFGG